MTIAIGLVVMSKKFINFQLKTGMARDLMKISSQFHGLLYLAIFAALTPAQSVYAVVVPDKAGLYMTGQEPGGDNSTVTSGVVTTGFNNAVARANRLVFGKANYATLSQYHWTTASLNFDDNGNYLCKDTAAVIGYLASDLERCAYYARDFSHQALAAYYLGFSPQNYAMLKNFSSNLYSADAYNSFTDPSVNASDLKPIWSFAYNGSKFEGSYQLPAPFELGALIGKLYTLTGDSRYIAADSSFLNYVKAIDLVSRNANYSDASGLGFQYGLSDGRHVTVTSTYNEFIKSNGAGESVLGADAASAQIGFYKSMMGIPTLRSAISTSNSSYVPGSGDDYVTKKYNTLLAQFNGSNWITSNNYHYTAIYASGALYSGFFGAYPLKPVYDQNFSNEPNFFPLYYNVVTNPDTATSEAVHIDSMADGTATADGTEWSITGNRFGGPGADIQGASYITSALFNGRQFNLAWKWLNRFCVEQNKPTNPSMSQNEIYPEVSFVIVSDLITKALGVDFSALPTYAAQYDGSLSTVPRLSSSFTNSDFIKVQNIPIYNVRDDTSNWYQILIGVKQEVLPLTGYYKTTLEYNSDQTATANKKLLWTPKFPENSLGQSCLITKHYNTSGRAPDSSGPTRMTFDDTTRTYSCQPIILNLGPGNYDDVSFIEVTAGNSLDPSASPSPGTGGTPTAKFAYSGSGLHVNFTNLSTDPGGAISIYDYAFGDGQHSSQTDPNPSHDYQGPGTYYATLTVTDGISKTPNTYGPQAVTVPLVTLPVPGTGGTPTAKFAYSGSGLHVNFTNLSTDPGGTISIYDYAFGDGQHSSQTDPSPSHDYPGPGTYYATLTVTDGISKTPNTYGPQAITVPVPGASGAPAAKFIYSVSGLHVAFTNLSTDPGGTISTYDYDFGEGGQHSNPNDPNPTHDYPAHGTYKVILTVTDSASKTTNFWLMRIEI